MDRSYYVYMMASKSRVLYAGITNDLNRRVWEHKEKRIPGFTQTYNVTKLVWLEEHPHAVNAIAREKQIKGWRRSKKIELVEAKNAQWRDLSDEIG